MYAIRNKVQLIGNLGQTPEVRTTENGKKVARFSIATHDTYRNTSGQKVSETLWHNVIAWGKLAEITEKYLTKGKEVAVVGKLVHRNYLDKNGIKRYVSEVVLNELLMLGGGKPQHEEAEPEEEVFEM
jgi:single-strand DNA-binding protein